jgi:hypothetical protein
MKLHTKLTKHDVVTALSDAVMAGKVSPAIDFAELSEGSSRTHARRFEVQLGTHNQHSLLWGATDQRGDVMHVRRVRQNGGGNGMKWAATYDEWGWFMAQVFARDSGAVFGGASPKSFGYRGLADFHAKTGNKFIPAITTTTSAAPIVLHMKPELTFEQALKASKGNIAHTDDVNLMAAFAKHDLPLIVGAVSPKLVWEGARRRGMTTLQLAELAVNNPMAVSDLQWDVTEGVRPDLAEWLEGNAH